MVILFSPNAKGNIMQVLIRCSGCDVELLDQLPSLRQQ